MCQTNFQKFFILLLFLKKILFLFKKLSILLGIISYIQCAVHMRKSDILQFLAATVIMTSSKVVFLNLYKLRTTNESCNKSSYAFNPNPKDLLNL